jgi:SAM-dependent methyltransferase
MFRDKADGTDGTSEASMPDRLAWGGARAASFMCLACGDATPRYATVSVVNPLGSPTVIEFYRCDRCGSLQPELFEQPSYYLDADMKVASRFYVHLGAGIDAMIRPVAAALRLMPDARTFLDVGCGFGFAVDFAGRLFGLDAHGIDPSAYAEEGARALHVRIFHEVLGHGSPIDARTFDIVCASEVLEHVEDPSDFLATLARAVADDGLLVLTTPAAESVTQDAWPEQVLSSLSPGYHRFLFSVGALREALVARGFEHVSVWRDREHLAAVASRRRDVASFRIEDERPAYRRYLSTLIESDVDVQCRIGAAFRLYKDQVNGGEFVGAASTRATMRALVADAYGLDVDSLASLSPAVDAPYDFNTFSDHAPFFLSGLLYCRGMELLNAGGGDPRLARDLFALTRRLAEKEIALPQAYFMETGSLYGFIRLHEALAALIAGDTDGAGRLFEELAVAGSSPATRGAISPLAIARSTMYQGVIDLQCGRPLDALGRLSAAIVQMADLPEAEGPLEEARRHMMLASQQLLLSHGCDQTSVVPPVAVPDPGQSTTRSWTRLRRLRLFGATGRSSGSNPNSAATGRIRK